MTRSKLLTVAILLLVIVAAVLLARPAREADFKDTTAFSSYQSAINANKPIFIMFTSDT